MHFNNNPFLLKALSKAIMHRSKLKNICNKYRTEDNWANYKKQRSYSPLVWMFCSRTSNSMINKLHERSLRIILNDYSSDFNILLENNIDICNHHKNVQALFIEVFKMKNELSPQIMESILNKRFNTYNLGNFQEFLMEGKKIFCFGLETLSYCYSQLWSLLLESLKEMNF